MDKLQRFSNRVENYVRFRPRYPETVAGELRKAGVLSEGMTVADIGSGTGFSAELFLDAGCRVIGVEPNKEMREAGDKLLSGNPRFSSADATAEATGLDAHSIDLVAAGQAFHWFDREKFKTECRRILRPGGNIALIWNDRQTDSTDFLKAYEDLLKMCGTDYKDVNHKNVADEVFDALWGKGNWKSFSVPNHQDFNFEGLKGRLFSSSYVPAEDHPDSKFMTDVLKKIFLRYQENGTVRFQYDTTVFYGAL
ncbi:MAG: methylase [Bacteroidetes bacterium]|nr:MAG: methylase [Bacteroidota bacterium]